MTLKEIKAAFFQSECGQYIREGVEVSEPVPILKDDKLVDVFFIYKVNRDKDLYTRPLAKFGIVLKNKEIVFSEPISDSSCVNTLIEMIRGSGSRKERILHYQDYEASYNKARELFYKECTEEEKERLREYWRTFKKYVEPNMLEFYMETAPEFYSWLQIQIQ